jgi:hypothetical protein
MIVTKNRCLCLYLLLVITLFLTACATPPKQVIVEVKETEVIKIKVPDTLLKPCLPDSPIDKESYLKLQMYERELYLTKYTVSILTNLKECNVQIDEIRKLQED